VKPFAVGAVLVLALAGLFIIPDAEAATTRSLEIWTATANPQVPFMNFDGNPPKLFDINGDGQLEIIAQNDNRWVYIFDSRTGEILFETTTEYPPGWGARSFNGPEVAILEQGGVTRLIVANSAAFVTSLRYDAAASSPGHMGFTKEWSKRANQCFGGAGMDAKPVLADLDKDGRMEILAATEEFGLIAFRLDGSLYWKNCLGGGNAEPTVADLNLDGWPDVVHVSDGGVVAALNGRTGAWMWGYSILSHFNLHSASIPVGAGIGQLDGVGGPDIVVGARDSHNSTDFSQDHALLLALDSGGRLLWAMQDLTDGNPLTYTHPVIVDAARDGTNEVYWADWNTIGHKPPANEADAWKTTGPANFYRYDNQGNLVWKQSLNTYWNNKDLALADVDDDGVQEVLANGPGTGGDGIWYLDSRTGAKESFIATTHWKVSRAPVVADLWGTGTMQWVVQVGAGDSTVSGGGILVYDTHVAYDSVYPHLPYPTVGAATPPPPPPPPAAGNFQGTFTITSPGQYWQQVTIQPDTPRTITRVDVRFPGYDWQLMKKESWGWTFSQSAPAGTTVEFLARDSNNFESQSAPFTWMDGTMSKRSIPAGSTTSTTSSSSSSSSSSTSSSTTSSTSSSSTTSPPPGPFTATFQPSAGVNEWWIEATVNANQPLAGVDARVNGQAWNPLAKTSWGTWAKSLHAAPGDRVEFRATSTSGGVVVSAPFTWLAADGPFAPTFEPRSQGNAWWVEAKVSGGVIVKVEASSNGGPWTSLPATSWGTWAKSYFVPAGTQVQFRATNDGGATALSTSYAWG
jgi:hypothetical protein